jgi:D-glycero-alpha-D-manno-heptose 1-phosphate guanylyltransferase
MALINGRPFLEYLFDYLLFQGVDKTVLAVGYKYEVILDHFSNKYKDMQIDYSIENEPLGTGGAIRLAMWKIKGERALVLNGDSMLRVDYREMYKQHMSKNASLTMAVLKVGNANRYGAVEMNRTGRITGFMEKQEEKKAGYINGGVYFIEKQYLMNPDFRGRFSMEKDCFERFHLESQFFGYRTDGYFIDIGIPSDYKRAQDEFSGFEN